MKGGQSTTFSADLQVLCEVSMTWLIKNLITIFFVSGYALFDIPFVAMGWKKQNCFGSVTKQSI